MGQVSYKIELTMKEEQSASSIKVIIPEGKVAGIITPKSLMLMKLKKCDGINSRIQVIATAKLPERLGLPPRYNCVPQRGQCAFYR